MKTLVIIPSRLESTRLSQKALAEICGKPMIEWVLQQTKLANVGEVVVATCGHEIASAVANAKGRYIITNPNLPSGTDRVWAAYQDMGEPDVDVIINVQGDLPLLLPNHLQDILKPFSDPDVDVSTLATLITDPSEVNNPNVVKICMDQPHDNIGRAVYFSRSAVPANALNYYHHVGVYAYRPQALKAFVNHPPCYLEQTEKLEQLRFLQHGFRIDVVIIESAPVSVDTYADLEKVRSLATDYLDKHVTFPC
ncbi:MAG: 3-deoxy-manno-octulosonate cytidylyltransferase [Proteobacteria bacterium]|nr:3-deoxy-manno-octulosonate cytidylyltransferase [Pseudomonadota bacterium]